MNISANIHPGTFRAVRGPGGSTWLAVEDSDTAATYAVIHVNTPEQADELVGAADDLKRMIAAALIHMEISASAVRCGAPVGPPGGLNLGQMTASPHEVTCPACKPRKYWQDAPAAGQEESK